MSVRDVAEAAGVSAATVSNAVNHPERVAPATLAKVQRAIELVGFVPNEAARQLRIGGSSTLGLVVLDISNPFFASVALGVEDRAAVEGRTVLLASSNQDPSRELSSLDAFERQRVAGVVLSPTSIDRGRIQQLLDREIIVVLVDRESADGFVPSVSVDDVAGGRIAVEHLVATGRQKIGFVGGPRQLAQVADRLAGAEQVIARTPNAHLLEFATDATTVEEGRAAGARIAELARSARPDAIFAANDLLAFGILQTFRAAGIDVPGDIAIIGYDDIEFAPLLEVPLSSVRRPSRVLGFRAADMLLTVAAGDELSERNVVLLPELAPRASTMGDRATSSRDRS